MQNTNGNHGTACDTREYTESELIAFAIAHAKQIKARKQKRQTLRMIAQLMRKP